MQPGERLWSKQILEASENTLQAKHSEEAGVHYGPSGGLERQGKLHVPWPLRAGAIPFDDDLMQESDDEDLAGVDDEEDLEERQSRRLLGSRTTSGRLSELRLKSLKKLTVKPFPRVDVLSLFAQTIWLDSEPFLLNTLMN